jgi:hypothetical protein
MNKILRIVRFILFVIVCFLNIYCIYIRHTGLISWSNVLYVFLLFIMLILFIKDFIKKSKINDNNTYVIICILCFLIMSFILYRTSFDTSLFFNKYFTNPYGGSFIEYRMPYLKQNMIYFNIMLILLLIYRRINFNKKIND